MKGSERDAGGYDSRAFVAEFYDSVPAYANRADREFYISLALKTHTPLLELGCGTGRLLIPIARAGVSITGLDLSEAMLAQCRRKLALEDAAVQRRATVVRGDMTAFSLPEKFALAVAPFRCFQHLLTVERQMACLTCVHQHLRREGLLILDMFQVEAARMHDPKFMQEEVEFAGLHLPNGRILGRSYRTAAFHRAEQINDCELIYYVTHPDGRSERLVHEFPLRYFFRYEVEHLLARTGFKLVNVFGNYDQSAFSDASPEMIVIAQKIEPAT